MGAPQAIGQRSGHTLRAGTSFDEWYGGAGERAFTKMVEGVDRCRRRRRIVRPMGWKLQQVTPRMTDGEGGFDHAYVRMTLWEITEQLPISQYGYARGPYLISLWKYTTLFP